MPDVIGLDAAQAAPDMEGGRPVTDGSTTATLEQVPEDLAARLREAKPFAHLDSWTLVKDRVPHVFEGLCFGVIRWNSELGRPAGPTLASGFEIRFEEYVVLLLMGGNGLLIEKGVWLSPVPVTSYDLPDEGDDHRVGFQLRLGTGSVAKSYRIVTSFAPGSHFHPDHPRFTQHLRIPLTITPSLLYFDPKQGWPLVLPEIHVVSALLHPNP
jgi:hypothetical protein